MLTARTSHASSAGQIGNIGCRQGCASSMTLLLPRHGGTEARTQTQVALLNPRHLILTGTDTDTGGSVEPKAPHPHRHEGQLHVQVRPWTERAQHSCSARPVAVATSATQQHAWSDGQCQCQRQRQPMMTYAPCAAGRQPAASGPHQQRQWRHHHYAGTAAHASGGPGGPCKTSNQHTAAAQTPTGCSSSSATPSSTDQRVHIAFTETNRR
jgi:hypothetical protein